MSSWSPGIVIVACALTASARAGSDLELRPATAETIHHEVRATDAKAVLVNVWSTWCAPCKREMPDLLRLRKSYRAKGLRLILISTDPLAGRRSAERFLQSVGVDFPTWIKNQSDMAFIDGLDRDWSGAQPVSILYDAGGKRIQIWEGETDIAIIERAIVALLGS